MNPLLLSGLAFAGANRRSGSPASAENGILTAEEVASIDLDGAACVILSACETGLGRIEAGEGILGLRRAFQAAGARTVVTSLWRVDDEATRRWMQSFYEARSVGNLNPAEAVREASRSVLAARRSRGLSAHPFYWAGFLAVGRGKEGK
jgi:CHAT domain-containing protein